MELETIRENACVSLQDALESILRRDKDEMSGLAYVAACYFYRRLALCDLLAEARSDRFAAFLCKSALARVYFLRVASDGRPAMPLYVCATRNFSFVDALAAGQLNLAVELARLTTSRFTPGTEYEDDFLFHRFLHALILRIHAGEHHDMPGLLERWESILEGNDAPLLDACRALLEKDVRRLNQALRDAISKHQRSFKEEKNEPIPQDRRLTEGFVFMNGLALLRLAELLDMPVQREYPLIPRFARIPLGRPLLPQDSWMRPEQAVPV